MFSRVFIARATTALLEPFLKRMIRLGISVFSYVIGNLGNSGKTVGKIYRYAGFFKAEIYFLFNYLPRYKHFRLAIAGLKSLAGSME
jgi:hypothetical protein